MPRRYVCKKSFWWILSFYLRHLIELYVVPVKLLFHNFGIWRICIAHGCLCNEVRKYTDCAIVQELSYSAFAISRGPFTPNISWKTSIAWPLGRGRAFFVSLEVSPKFYFRSCCALQYRVMLHRDISRVYSTRAGGYTIFSCRGLHCL